MKNICIAKKVSVISLALFACLLGACGRKHVQGIVKDPFGNTIDSVSVQVVKSTFTALTNKNGEYSVDYVPGTFVMRFSKQGYTTQNMELTIQQKMRFPADTVIMYPIPESQGIFLIGEKELIELQPVRVASSQMQISWMSMRYSYSSSELGSLIIKPGRLRFIDKIPRPIKLARLGHNNLIQEFDTELGRRFTYNGVVENEDKEEIGEEKLLIRTVIVERGSYAWVELVQSFMGFRPNENSPCYPFQVEYSTTSITKTSSEEVGVQVQEPALKQSSISDVRTAPREKKAQAQQKASNISSNTILGFRANLQRTGVYNTKGVHQINGIKWKFKGSGEIITSPFIADGVAFFTDSYSLYSVDLDSGTYKWDFSPGYNVETSPIASDGLVYYGSHNGNFYAIDMYSGQEKWKFDTDFAIRSSAVVVDEMILFGSDNKNLYALNKSTGEEKWRFTAQDGISSSPSIAFGKAFFGGVDGNFYAVDIQAGNLAWRFQASRAIISSAAIMNGNVFVGSIDGNLYALSSETGQEKWRFTTPKAIRSSPAVANGMIYFGSDDGNLYAVDESTGQLRWKFGTGDDVSSSPSIAEGIVYFGSRDGYLYAVDMQTGYEKWKFNALTRVRSSPVIADGVVYFGCFDGTLYAIW